jgi:hypothetical protein
MPRSQTKQSPASPRAVPAPVIEPLVVRRPEAARVLCVGMTKLKEMIRNRDVEEVRVGKASLITVRSLRRFVGEPSSSP